MSVYSELLDLLTPRCQTAPPGLLGTLTCLSPLTVTVGGTALTQNLLKPRGRVFTSQDVGCRLALLPYEGGLFILGPAEEGTT